MGSTGPESTGVRCMTFNPDGKILLCGLQENLKVYSWEPVVNHDTIDVGWSGLSDLTVHEGKLLGCSCNQSCVGVWVVDISRIEPYSVCAAASNDQLDKKSHSGGSSLQTEENTKGGSGRNSSQNSDLTKESGSISRLSAQQSSDLTKDTTSLTYGSRVSNSDLNVDQPQTVSQKGGRTNSSVLNSEQKDRIFNYRDQVSSNISRKLRGYHLTCENESVSSDEEDTMADLMELHDQFVGSMRSRLSRLQIVHSFWQRHDIKGVFSAISKMDDHSVLADVMSFFSEKTDMVTLDICACLLPLLSGLLESNMDRHQDISLDMLLKLVRTFGSLIYSSLSAQSSVGVNIEAEQRLERCNLCFIELEKVKLSLPLLSRKGGSIAKSAQELNLALHQVS